MSPLTAVALLRPEGTGEPHIDSGGRPKVTAAASTTRPGSLANRWLAGRRDCSQGHSLSFGNAALWLAWTIMPTKTRSS
jgi:hypothetical protein